MRSAGVLMHISSLPSPYGIGSLGKEARRFVDFLAGAGQTYWQVLPLSPTSYGDSPYQSFSGFAGNPYFIDLETLCSKGYLKKRECEEIPWGKKEDRVDYSLLYENRFPLLRKACERFDAGKNPGEKEAFHDFCTHQAEWLEDYALFMALKAENGGASWSRWPREVKLRQREALEEARERLREEIHFFRLLQFFFYRQWFELKDYANRAGISIIGDIPIYVAEDSADVWAHPEQFYLDEECNPIEVAGCPPDAFSADGQLWGNPLFRWDVMKEGGYRWWIQRIRHVARQFDVVRIDHFRGFDSYYAIPWGSANAREGRWKPGPGMELFRAIEEALGRQHIIVEDLGYLTESVKQLVKDSGYPGMKLVQFGFDTREDGDYRPHTYPTHCVVYAGTHDNDTILGWMKTAPRESVRMAKDYLRLNPKEGYNWGMMKSIWASAGDMAIVTMQDILGLGSEARMNTPSTMGNNWVWRMKKGAASAGLARKLKHNMEVYGRSRQ